MKIVLQIILLLFFNATVAQKSNIESVYFEVAKFTLNQNQINTLLKHLDSLHFSESQNIEIYGFCDERGSTNYNFNLSKKRVDFVNELLISNGIPSSKIITLQGRGEINFVHERAKNLKLQWTKNRRVDLIFNKNSLLNDIPVSPKLSNVIVLENVNFELGSSELSLNSKKELDRFVLELKKHKTLRFEIKGHVCCTAGESHDAIDKATDDRNLSKNRAKNVYLYLRSKGISPYRMTFKGYGNNFPLGKKEAKDRRVEFFITHL